MLLLKLAICDDIGEAAYDTQRIAAKFLDLLKELQARRPDGTYDQTLQARYGLDLSDTTGEGFLSELAALKVSGRSGTHRSASTQRLPYGTARAMGPGGGPKRYLLKLKPMRKKRVFSGSFPSFF